MSKFPFLVGIVVVVILFNNYNKKKKDNDDGDHLMKHRFHF